jgi:hypothetical protein
VTKIAAKVSGSGGTGVGHILERMDDYSYFTIHIDDCLWVLWYYPCRQE